MSEFEIHHNDPSRFWGSVGPRLVEEMAAVVARMRADHARMLELVAEADRASIHRLAGYSSPAALVSAVTRVSPKQAKRWVVQAEAVSSGVTPTGHVTPPTLPGTAAALADAAIDGEHVEVIVRAIGALPHWVDSVARAEFEAALAGHARGATPVELRVRAERMLMVLDQDGPQPGDAPLPEQPNYLSWRRRRDGRVQGRFELCPVDGARFEALIGPLAAPRTSDGTTDLRSQTERAGDALAEVIDLALSAPDLPTEAGERPHLAVTVALADLESGLRRALIDHGGTLTASQARLLACDAKIIPHVLGGAGLPLDVGRARYTVPPHLRRALILRDRGCAFPDCDRRPRACAAHHVQHWARGGPTALGNLVLLCPRHHRLIHNSEWQVRITTSGRPEFTAPAYLAHHRHPPSSHPPPPAAAAG
ncbi:HNH endonuclease signature motif containing protein [Actinokineospora sp. NBRC 105648]|uniref:HNH endonuclease signature motif containing protein n=1 Tax=Actinokineospora sp. NBRC 105648 TaxID=3032206 RepID=UPI0024A42699|nr:HNH endonuclease signature motif containing protein [Actinokineospora sp. NBRC 105648]GLZ39519.1 HNH endonuclease [Actinokineospora sp. NBRC 105648]